MDATEMLTRDHEKVRTLFRKFHGGGGLTGLVRRVTGAVAARDRQTAVDGVCRELDMHTRIEEQIFYPAIGQLDDDELNAQLAEARDEHAKVKQQVARLRGARVDEPDIDTRMQELEQCVEHHASEEEKEMFPRVRTLMSDAERGRLAREMRAMKHDAEPTRRRATSPERSRRRAASARKTRSTRAGEGRGGAKHAGTKPAGKRRARAKTRKTRIH